MKVLRNKPQTPNVCIIGLILTETLGLVRRTWFQNSFKVFGILRQDSILSCTESHHQLKKQYSKLQHICLSPPSPSQMKRDALTGKPRLMKRETTSHLERVILSPEIQRMETAFFCNLPVHFARECRNKNKREKFSNKQFQPRQANQTSQTNEEQQPAMRQIDSAPSTMSQHAPEFHPNYQQKWQAKIVGKWRRTI